LETVACLRDIVAARQAIVPLAANPHSVPAQAPRERSQQTVPVEAVSVSRVQGVALACAVPALDTAAVLPHIARKLLAANLTLALARYLLGVSHLIVLAEERKNTRTLVQRLVDVVQLEDTIETRILIALRASTCSYSLVASVSLI
jgi:hypothetical protein